MEKRINWLDAAKGIVILLVVIGHSISDSMRQNNLFFNVVYTTIYAFHMPLMFFLSGYAFEKFSKTEKITTFFNKKTKSLLKPWIVYSLIAYIIFGTVNLIPVVKNKFCTTSMQIIPFSEYLLDMLKGNNPYCFHLWFIYVLFLVSIAVRIACIRQSNNRRYIAISYIFCFAYILLNNYANVFGYFMYEIIWFCLGAAYVSVEGEKTVHRSIAICLMISLIVFSYLKCIKIQGIITWWKAINIPLTFGVIVFIVQLCKYIENKKRSKLLTLIGRHSFVIYLLHQPICAVSVIFANSMGLPNVIILFIGVVISFSFPSLYLFIINKNHFIRRWSEILLNI